MAVRIIKPKGINIAQMKKAIDQGLLATGAVVKADIKLATGTWEHEVKWEEKLGTQKGNREWSYTTTDEIYKYVDDGTKGPYPIPKVPKTDGFLKFQEGFVPKTAPGRLVAGPGASFGKFVYAKQVMHPGIAARNMTKQVAERVMKEAAWRMQDAIKEAFGQSSAALVAAGMEK